MVAALDLHLAVGKRAAENPVEDRVVIDYQGFACAAQSSGWGR